MLQSTFNAAKIREGINRKGVVDGIKRIENRPLSRIYKGSAYWRPLAEPAPGGGRAVPAVPPPALLRTDDGELWGEARVYRTTGDPRTSPRHLRPGPSRSGDAIEAWNATASRMHAEETAWIDRLPLFPCTGPIATAGGQGISSRNASAPASDASPFGDAGVDRLGQDFLRIGLVPAGPGESHQGGGWM